MNKLKDVAGLLKAKITKDELEQALINATSQQNWQASTHILHEIANAAYNYEKWQQINEFIWDKLKKGKSWRKILKTLNLVEFLLKNGPPSIISSFKYDIYQFRSFDNFSHYDDGLDRGESIRERAKVIVDLLSNEELLEEERLKAKTIRERMSGVVGGSGNYGGFTGNSSVSGSKYGSIDNKSYQTGGYGTTPSFNDGGLGVYGDYGTTKSTLDKYKDNKTTLTQGTIKKTTTSNITTPLVEDKKEPVVDNKKPFQTIAPKLVKPGSKPAPKQQTVKPQTNTNIIDDDILGGGETLQTQPVQPTYQQPKVEQTFVQPATNVQNTSPIDLGFSFDTPAVKPQTTQPFQQAPQAPQQTSQPILNQPQTFQPQPQVLPTQPLYPPQTNVPNAFNGLNLNYNNPTLPQQTPSYGQQNLYGYGQQQPGMMGGYPQQGLYGQQFQQPMAGFNPQTAAWGQSPQYQQPTNQFSQPSWNQGISLSTRQVPQNIGNISLKTTTQPKKQDDEFGNFSSGQNNNVKWLTSEEKGLIDFSDFGDELKGGNKNKPANNTNNLGNNIDTTWTW